MSITATTALSVQDQFSTTTSATFSASDTTLYLTALPTPSEGFLTLYSGTSVAEIVYYTSKGSNFVTIPSATTGNGRGMYGTPQSFSSGTTVKMTVNADLIKQMQLGNAINFSTNKNLATGGVVQIVETPYTTYTTGTTIIPADDTIPQNTEGDQYMTQAITPTSATNRLIIEGVALVSNSAANNTFAAAIFQDTTANALAAGSQFQATASTLTAVPFYHSMVAGTTSSTTFKIRAGSNQAGTTGFNGAGGRFYGAITKSWIKVTEVKV